jgi:hypothetical protein
MDDPLSEASGEVLGEAFAERFAYKMQNEKHDIGIGAK